MIEVLLIGVSLSMDAFAVSVANSLTLRGFTWRQGVVMAAYFGFFQFMMPLAGWLLCGLISGYIHAFAPYISFVLLAFIGVKMLLDALKPQEGGDGMDKLSHLKLLALAVATSIDALAVGVSFALTPPTGMGVLTACVLIGVTTFVISFAGAMLGSRVPGLSGKRAGILGGCVLVVIGVKLLLEGVL